MGNEWTVQQVSYTNLGGLILNSGTIPNASPHMQCPDLCGEVTKNKHYINMATKGYQLI